MERITAMLTRRLGPLPVWAWAVVVAGAILAYAYWRRSQDDGYAVAPVASPESLAADAGFLDGLDDIPGDGDEGEEERDIDFTSNAAWARYVVDKLTIRGEDPLLVTNALSKVLYGEEVTQQEAAIYNEAVRLYGPPPEPVPIIRIKPGTTNPNPDPDPEPEPIPTHVIAPANSNLYDWVSSINARYPGLNVSFIRIFGAHKNDINALNPDARNHMDWLPAPGAKIPVFRSPRNLRIK